MTRYAPSRRELAVFAIATALTAVTTELACGQAEPSIAIRPFGALPPQAFTTSVAADAVGAEPTALTIDGAAHKLYWAESAAGRIRRAGLDGEGDETIVEGLDAPVALALDVANGRIYWATDGNFPRKIQRATLDGKDVETLVAGEELNRPGALAIDARRTHVYWVESVSGRMRRADLDGSSIETLLEERTLTSLGLALTASDGRIYWSDLTHAAIRSANIDGTNVEDVLGEDDGLDAPTGIALDDAGGVIYWADRGAAAIRRAKLDGTAVADVAGPARGVVDPRALAFDRERRKIYWTDLARDEIRRADADGTNIETVVRSSSGFERTIGASVPDAGTQGATKLAVCSEALNTAGRRFAQARYKSLVTCLDKMSWVKAVKWRANEPALAAATCARALAEFAPRPEQGAGAALVEALANACDPAKHGFALGDLSRLMLDASGATCPKMPGAAPSLGAWSECVEQRYDSLVFDAVNARYPRALEWLEEARPFVRRLASDGPPKGGRVPAVAPAGVEAVYDRIAKLAAPPSRAATGLPATGLVTAYASDKNDGVEGPVVVADDGAVRAGAPLRFRDNGDGTIADLATGLMWEKKCDGCGDLHDSLMGYRWSGNGLDDTIWDWLDQLNADGGKGFAGHSDWRVPNVKELVSILNYERFNPAVSTAFDEALCGLGCGDVKNVECSCTASGPYWSATTFSDFPAHGLVVLFNLGLVGDEVKTTRHFVRAVRGPAR